MSKKLTEAFFEGLKGSDKSASPVPPPQSGPVGATLDRSNTFATPKPITSRNMFSHPDTHPFVLDMVLLKKFGLDWFEWTADTLFHVIEKDFSTPIAEVNRLKIMAAKTLHVIDAFWEEWEIFEKIICSLNSIIPRLDVMQPPDLPSLFVGVDIANSIRMEEFGDEVKRYCAAVFLHENVHYAPLPLNFCQEYISQPLYICKDCDKKGSALPPFDGHCPSCSQKFEQDKAFSLKPDPTSKFKGTNVEYTLTYDPATTKKRFEELESMPDDKVAETIRETPEDLESARLIVAVDYMRFKQSQLKDQLERLRSWMEAS